MAHSFQYILSLAVIIALGSFAFEENLFRNVSLSRTCGERETGDEGYSSFQSSQPRWSGHGLGSHSQTKSHFV